MVGRKIRAPLRVLVVEDSEDDAVMILRELGRAGHATEHRRVQTPEAMREALAGSSWDLIVSDHQMPRFSAPEALELAREAGSEAPLVVVSGRIGEDVAVDLVTAGAHDYVMKDNLARLRPTVERALEEAEARRERRRAEEELGRSERRYRAVIEQATDGIYLLDAGTKRLLETNPAFRRMLGYADGEMRGMQVYGFVAHPRENVDYVIRRTLDQKRRFVGERKYRRKDGSLLDVEVGVSVISEGGGREVICTIVRDVTERKKNEEALRQSEELYRTVIEQATENICLVDAETGRIVESNSAFRDALGYAEGELRRLTLYDIVDHDRASIDENIRHTVEQRRRFVGERRYRRKDGTLLEVEVSASTILRGGRETLCIVAHDVTERARAERRLEERVSTLSLIASSLTLNAPAQETLQTLAETAVGASTATVCTVMLADEEAGTIRVVGSHGLPEGYTEALHAAFRAGVPSPTLAAIRERRPALLRDGHRRVLDQPLYAPLHRFADEVAEDTNYIVPLIFRDRVVGAMNFGYLPDREPSEEEKVFLRAVADQTAVAVENARLLAQARDKATLEERQRLARELHDSVSQALYGIVLSARSARDALDAGDREGTAGPLDYVLSLSRASLSEMRALIFELRPESLQREGLVAALRKQAAAMEARHGLLVEAALRDEPDVSPETKEALYRIAQEALHNTLKHARASGVRLELGWDGTRIALDVGDDGAGFDARGDFPGHLGLRSMRERAARLGGTLEIESAPGKGTRVSARIPV